MKLLFCVTRSDTLGGAQIHIADLASAMQNCGDDIVIVTGGNGVFCQFMQKRGLRFVACGSLLREASFFNDVSAALELRRLVKSEAPDIVALHSVKAGFLGRVACVGLSLRVVYTVHGWSVTHGRNKVQQWLYWTSERILAKLTSAVIFVCRHDRRVAQQRGMRLGRKGFLVHNALPNLPDGNVSDLPADSLGTRIVSVARFQAPKDHLTLFRALATLDNHRWTLDLIGDGPEERQAREAVEQLGLGHRVRFLGLQEGVSALLPNYDVFVLSTRSEGFPLSILEAMRAGLPVLASAVGGIPEAVQDGVTGCLFEPGDVRGLREAFGRMLSRPQLLADMGAAGRKRFLKEFELSQMVGRTRRIYEGLLRAGRGVS